MNAQLDITYRNMEASESTDFLIREQVEKIERHCPSLTSCRVVVTAPTHGTKGGHFEVSVDLRMPGREIIADRDPKLSQSHEDFHEAVRDVFRAAMKELDRAHAKDTNQRRHPR